MVASSDRLFKAQGPTAAAAARGVSPLVRGRAERPEGGRAGVESVLEARTTTVHRMKMANRRCPPGGVSMIPS
jgi:hypothetical protein